MPEAGIPRHAIILAAGMGTRLRSAVRDRPKGLLEIEGETLVGRSIRLLRAAGVEGITIVAGYGEDHYRRFASGHQDLRIVVNQQYATTGSMASLAAALAVIEEDVLVLESDIVYEPRALQAMASGEEANATLMSGPTGAGDEVWVYAPGERLHAMSKVAAEIPAVSGEFVGITRLSTAAASAMGDAFAWFVERYGHGRMDYECDALVAIARSCDVGTILIPDLCWGEIDDERHLERVTREVWPRLQSVAR